MMSDPQKRILIVDDDTNIASLISFALEQSGYQVVTAFSMEDALIQFDVMGYDLVITDIFMPGMGGIEGIKVIRSKQLDTKIIGISAGFFNISPEEALEAAKKIGADVVLPKPFNLDVILRMSSLLLADNYENDGAGLKSKVTEISNKSDFLENNHENGLLPYLYILDQVHNLAAICQKNRIIYLNATGIMMLGLPEGENGLGEEFTSFFHPDFSGIADMGLDVFAKDESVISIKLNRPDGVEVEAEVWVTQLDFPGEDIYLVEAHNITNHMRAARALRSREQRLEGIINTVADGIISLDDNGTIRSFNPAAETIFGFSKDEVLGKNVRTLIPIPINRDVMSAFGREWAGVLTLDNSVIGKRKSVDTFPIEMAVREMHYGAQLTFASIIRYITSLKKAEASVRELAHHDALTGLPNRHLLGDRLEEAAKRAHRHKNKFALMFVDLDKFKAINDELGHDAGDEALLVVSDRLTSSIRKSDTAARVGGDEFVIILEGLNDTGEAEEVADKIITNLREPMKIKGVMRAIGSSIGIAFFPDHGADTNTILNCADQALYSVKRQTDGNHYRVFRPEENETADEGAP